MRGKQEDGEAWPCRRRHSWESHASWGKSRCGGETGFLLTVLTFWWGFEENLYKPHREVWGLPSRLPRGISWLDMKDLQNNCGKCKLWIDYTWVSIFSLNTFILHCIVCQIFWMSCISELLTDGMDCCMLWLGCPFLEAIRDQHSLPEVRLGACVIWVPEVRDHWCGWWESRQNLWHGNVNDTRCCWCCTMLGEATVLIPWFPNPSSVATQFSWCSPPMWTGWTLFCSGGLSLDLLGSDAGSL